MVEVSTKILATARLGFHGFSLLGASYLVAQSFISKPRGLPAGLKED